MGRRKQATTDVKRLRAALAERDLELVSVSEPSPDGSLGATANKLHLVPGPGGKPLYAPIPVSLRIQRDESGNIRTVTGDKPEASAVADATRFVETLFANNSLADADGVAPPGATHQVEIDSKGRRILRRRRFSVSRWGLWRITTMSSGASQRPLVLRRLAPLLIAICPHAACVVARGTVSSADSAGDA